MIKIVAEHFVKEESRDSFMALARDLVNESRKETGNISYHLISALTELISCILLLLRNGRTLMQLRLITVQSTFQG